MQRWGPARSRVVARDEGLTLVEMLVALALLSVILAAVASSLITFSRAAADNERRVQATALNNRLHEDLQSVPWFDAANYELELGAITDPPAGLDVAGRTFDGRDLVVLDGPSSAGCGVDPECNRRERVPRAHQTIQLDGRDYEVFQFVTWQETDPQVKRYTTVVRWELLGRSYEERFESTRAATAFEAGDPTRPRVIQFQVGPSPHPLVPDGVAKDTNSQDLDIVLRFSNPVTSAVVRFYRVALPLPEEDSEDPIELVEQTVGMTPGIPEGGGYITFTGTIPAGTYVFPDGSRTVRAVGTLGSETFTGTTSVIFTGGSIPPMVDPGDEESEPPEPGEEDEGDAELEPPAQPVSLGTVTVTPGAVCTDQNDRFTDAVTVSVVVTGMTPDDYSVSVTYTIPGDETRTEAMEPVGDPLTISPAGHEFRRVFAAGQSHGFVLDKNNDSHTTTFSIVASRTSDGGSAGPATSAPFKVTKRNNPSPGCT